MAICQEKMISVTVRHEAFEEQLTCIFSSIMLRENSYFFEELLTENPADEFTIKENPAVFRQIEELLRGTRVQRLMEIPQEVTLVSALQRYGIHRIVRERLHNIGGSLVNADVVFAWLNESIRQDCKNIIKVCCLYVSQNTNNITNSEAFLNIDKPCLKILLHHHALKLSPEDIFRVIRKWATQQYGDLDGPKLRKKLGNDILCRIPFRNMSENFFNEDVVRKLKGLLTEKCALQIGKFISYVNTLPSVNGCQANARIVYFRFPKDSTGKKYGKKADAISFSVDTDCYLTHFFIYGTCQNPGDYTLEIEFKNEENVLYKGVATCGPSLIADKLHGTHLADIREVHLKPELKLNRNEFYSLIVTLDGPISYFGDEGFETITQNGVTITFSDCFEGLNGTCVKNGQFPGFVFQRC